MIIHVYAQYGSSYGIGYEHSGQKGPQQSHVLQPESSVQKRRISINELHGKDFQHKVNVRIVLAQMLFKLSQFLRHRNENRARHDRTEGVSNSWQISRKFASSIFCPRGKLKGVEVKHQSQQSQNDGRAYGCRYQSPKSRG